MVLAVAGAKEALFMSGSAAVVARREESRRSGLTDQQVIKTLLLLAAASRDKVRGDMCFVAPAPATSFGSSIGCVEANAGFWEW